MRIVLRQRLVLCKARIWASVHRSGLCDLGKSCMPGRFADVLRAARGHLPSLDLTLDALPFRPKTGRWQGFDRVRERPYDPILRLRDLKQSGGGRLERQVPERPDQGDDSPCSGFVSDSWTSKCCGDRAKMGEIAPVKLEIALRRSGSIRFLRYLDSSKGNLIATGASNRRESKYVQCQKLQNISRHLYCPLGLLALTN